VRRLCALLALAALAVPAARAAEPASGTVSLAAPQTAWTGTSTAGGATTIPGVANGGSVACAAPSCDAFALTVADGGDLAITADAPGTGGFTMVEVVKPDGSTQYAMGAEARPRRRSS